MENPERAQPRSLLALGGADGIGMWLVKRVFAASSLDRITLADVKPLHRAGQTDRGGNPDARHLAELAGLSASVDAIRLANGGEIVDWAPVDTAGAPPTDPLTFGDYDLVMIAVPEDQVDTVASSVLPRMGRGSTVFDVVSTKERPIEAMLRRAPEGVGVFGTHPLFGPAVPDVIGQTVMLTPTRRTLRAAYEWWSSLLRSQGAIVEETDARAHDRYMLLVQTLTHYAYLVFGKTLGSAEAMGYSFEESLRYSAPPYSILAAFTSRIIGGNPRLYAQIQGHPDADELRRLFVEAADDLAERFSKGGAHVLTAIEEIVNPFRGSDIARAYANSIALVDSVQQSYRDLYGRLESGELTIAQVSDPLARQAAARLHVGIVTDVDGQSVEITKRQTVVDGKWYLAYDAESEAALRRAGRGVRLVKTRIERRNIRRVYTREETREWRAAHLDHHRRDIAALADAAVDLSKVCEVLTRLHDDVVSSEALPAQGAGWLGGYGMQNVLLRFSIFGDRDPSASAQRLVDSLRLFGIRTRA